LMVYRSSGISRWIHQVTLATAFAPSLRSGTQARCARGLHPRPYAWCRTQRTPAPPKGMCGSRGVLSAEDWSLRFTDRNSSGIPLRDTLL
jgi:hypothetical protein